MDRRFTGVFAVGAFLCAPLAGAAGPLPPFSFVDEDGDREISRSEAQAERQLFAVFDQLDADRNGRLTRLEYLGASHGRYGSASPVALDRGSVSEPLLRGNILP